MDDGTDLVVDRDPAHPLRPRAESTPEAELERRQHLGEGAAPGRQHDAAAEMAHPDPGRRDTGLAGGTGPAAGQPGTPALPVRPGTGARRPAVAVAKRVHGTRANRPLRAPRRQGDAQRDRDAESVFRNGDVAAGQAERKLAAAIAKPFEQFQRDALVAAFAKIHSDGCGDQSLLRSHSCCRQIRRWNRQENLQSRERRVFETGKNSDDVRQRAKSEHAAENHRGRREPEPSRARAAIRHGERDERNRNEA